jgi:hypothetical protein
VGVSRRSCQGGTCCLVGCLVCRLVQVACRQGASMPAASPSTLSSVKAAAVLARSRAGLHGIHSTARCSCEGAHADCSRVSDSGCWLPATQQHTTSIFQGRAMHVQL